MLLFQSDAVGALLVMAHPCRWVKTNLRSHSLGIMGQ
jgi:hypothetical protein